MPITFLADFEEALQEWIREQGGGGELLLLTIGLLIAGIIGFISWRRGWYRTDYKVTPGLLDPVTTEPGDVPPDVERFFNQYHPELERLRLSFVEECQMVHGKEPIYARFYAEDGREEYAELDVCKRYCGGLLKAEDLCALTFVTVFEDGTCLETCNIRAPENGRMRPPQLVYRFRPKLKAPELLEEHHRAVRAYLADHPTEIVRYPAAQAREVSAYYAQYQRNYWHSKKWITAPAGRVTEVAPTVKAVAR